jgi:hypothetical protein
VPPPEFDTLNVWLGALEPSILEFDKELVLREMLGEAGGAFTVKLTVIVCESLSALGSLIVIVALRVPADNPEVL